MSGDIRIFIVDDEPDFCASLRCVLTAHGFEIDVAQSAAEAKDTFAKRPRAVVLLDMKLNGESGFEVLSAMRDFNPSVSHIAMSGVPEMPQRMHQALSDTTVACFQKPLDSERLTETLGNSAAGPGTS